MAFGAAIFYTFTGDPKTANKSLTQVASSAALQPLEPINNLTARLVVDYKSAAFGADYFSFDGKYYKITDRKALTAQALEITGAVDTLKTYWNQIKDCPAVCERSTTKYNSKVNDPLYPVEQKKQVWVKNLFDLPNNDITVFGYIE